MALLKKETEDAVTKSDENHQNRISDCNNGNCFDSADRLPSPGKTEVLQATEGTSNMECGDKDINMVDVHVKQEINANATLKYDPDLPTENDKHSDHTYISNGHVFKQEIQQDITNQQNLVQSLQNSDTLHNIVKEEIKLYPEECCEAYFKNEANNIKPVNNVHVKTETVDSNADANIGTNNIEMNNLQYIQRLQTYKCSKCKLSYVDERIFKTHVTKCGFNGDSRPVPFVKTVKNIPTTKIQKCNQCDYSHNLRKLIESIRKHPCLYNPNNEDYKNIQLKNVIWGTIASECNLPNSAVAKSEWRKLKVNFLQALKQQNAASHSHRKQNKKWKYQQMDFLIPYLNNRPTNTDNEDENTNPLQETSEGNQPSVRPEINDVEEDAEDDCSLVHAGPPAKKVKLVSPHREVTSFLKTPQRNREERTELSSRQSRDEARPSTSSQPLDMFFLSMCETTKNLPPYVQLQVKKKIFQAVIEAEEIVAAMNNDQAKDDMFHASANTHEEYPNNMSPFSVHSAVDDALSWQED